MIAAGIAPIFDPNPARTSIAPTPSLPFSLTTLTPLSLRLFLTTPRLPLPPSPVLHHPQQEGYHQPPVPAV